MYNFTHGLGETIDTLIQAGLVIDFVHEHKVVHWQALPTMVTAGKGLWKMPDGKEDYLSYAVDQSTQTGIVSPTAGDDHRPNPLHRQFSNIRFPDCSRGIWGGVALALRTPPPTRRRYIRRSRYVRG